MRASFSIFPQPFNIFPCFKGSLLCEHKPWWKKCLCWQLQKPKSKAISPVPPGISDYMISETEWHTSQGWQSPSTVHGVP